MGSPFGAGLRAIAAIYTSVARHSDLLWQMVRREVAGRYRGSVGGMAWALVLPLMRLSSFGCASRRHRRVVEQTTRAQRSKSCGSS